MPKSDRKGRTKKTRKRERRDSPDSSLERRNEKKRRLEKLTKKIEKHWKKHHIAPKYATVDVENTLGIVEAGSQNPFNDANIGERFVWRKKVQQELVKGVPLEQFSAGAEQERQKSRMEEWEKVKQRREKRELEKAQQQEELSQVQRDRAAAEAQLLITREEHFHLSQAVDRAERRISEGRQRSIDRLIRNLHLWKKMGVDEQDPSLIVEPLGKLDLLQLGDDIKELSEVDTKDALHKDYWMALKNIWENKMTQLNKLGKYGGDGSGHTRQRMGIVEEELKEMMEGKSLNQLEILHADLLKEEAIDPDFYQAAKVMIATFKAQASLREVNLQVLERYYNWKRQQQQQQQSQQLVGEAEELEVAVDENRVSLEDDFEDQMVEVENREKFEELYSFLGRAPKQEVGPCLLESDGRFSPPPIRKDKIPKGSIIVDWMDDLRQIFNRRCQIQAKMVRDYASVGARLEADGGSKQREYHQMIMDKPVQPILRYIADAAPQTGEKSFRSGRDDEVLDDRMIAQARRAMGPVMEGDNEHPFAQEYALESQSAQSTWFNLKYQPRKPKYFNRVHTGYEWNKYNQTHYDADNPPPKVVQGYKFNIFYPDLIDKAKAPIYRVERDPDTKDGSTCVLRFTAGPPYEDIAFRIVNKEWEYSHKRGFKCVWERDMLQLYFNFKRQRYRR